MNAIRLAALCLSFFVAGVIVGRPAETQAPARTESWRNGRYLMQSKADPSKWEALEVLANEPGSYNRTELTPAQARRWAEQGGFRHIPNQEYNARLAIAGGYAAARARVAYASRE
jgi:hypothetical protein